MKKENKREGKNPGGPRRRKEGKRKREGGKEKERVRKRGEGKSVAVENCFQATRGNLLIGCPRSGR